MRGQDLHLRSEVMSLSYCPTLLPRHEFPNTRKVRVAGVEPAWTFAQEMWVAATLHPDCGRTFQPSPVYPHAHDLAQRVYHVHQIALRFHHRVNGLVRHRSFVDHITPPCQSEPILSKVSSTDKELFRIPGGHIGIMAGSGASKSTWPHIDGWLAPRSKGAISPAAF